MSKDGEFIAVFSAAIAFLLVAILLFVANRDYVAERNAALEEVVALKSQVTAIEIRNIELNTKLAGCRAQSDLCWNTLIELVP